MLSIWHRRSIDFDLFTQQDLKRRRIKRLIEKHEFIATEILYEASEQLHLVVNDVKLTFFQFPHAVEHPIKFENIIQLPSLLDLAAMKAYALGAEQNGKIMLISIFC